MRHGKKQRAVCQICGNVRAFNLISARISSRDFQQTAAGRWKGITTQYRQPDHRVSLAVVCSGCGALVKTLHRTIEMSEGSGKDGRKRRQTRKA